MLGERAEAALKSGGALRGEREGNSFVVSPMHARVGPRCPLRAGRMREEQDVFIYLFTEYGLLQCRTLDWELQSVTIHASGRCPDRDRLLPRPSDVLTTTSCGVGRIIDSLVVKSAAKTPKLDRDRQFSRCPSRIWGHVG